jgi:hypothetical protein
MFVKENMEFGKKVDEIYKSCNPSYVFSQSTPIIISSKDKMRIRKINKIFRNKDIVDIFQPSSFYGIIQTKNPL